MRLLKYNTLSCLASALIIVTLGYLFTNKLDKSEYISTGIDTWEYNSIAVNFAKYNKFPLMGLYGDETLYQTDRLDSNPIEDYLYCRWSRSGSVYSFEKPPIYALTLGITYKLFGINLDHVYKMNFTILIVSLFFIIKIGNKLFSNIFLSVLAAVLFLFFGTYNSISNISPDLMFTLLILITTDYILNREHTQKMSFYIGLGILFAILMLTKGNMVFFLMLYPLYLLFNNRFQKSCIKNISVLSLVFFITLIPWISYSNFIRYSPDYKPEIWKSKFYESEKKCDISSDYKFKQNPERKHQSEILKNNLHHKLVNHLWESTYAKSSFIVISNQIRIEEIRSLHNEFLTNGEWRPEWRFINTAYYNTKHTQSHPLIQIAFFYMENPGYLFKNAYLKMYQAIGNDFSFFSFALLLTGICLLFNLKLKNQISIWLSVSAICIFLVSYIFNLKEIIVVFSSSIFIIGILYRLVSKNLKSEWLHPALLLILLNSFLFISIFYGGQRFIYSIDPLSIITSLYLLKKLITLNYQKTT